MQRANVRQVDREKHLKPICTQYTFQEALFALMDVYREENTDVKIDSFFEHQDKGYFVKIKHERLA